MSDHFYHDDHTSTQVFDARDKPSATIESNEVFYIGYQVSIGNAMWYHHAVLLVNTSERLLSGSALLVEQIRRDLCFNPCIVPVFVRSLLAGNEDVVDSAYRTDIAKEIEAHMLTKQPGGFLVFGIIGNSKITLIKIMEDDAIKAVAAAAAAIYEQLGESFFPVDVCLAHQVTGEFSARYDAAVHRINSLLLCEQGTAVH